MSWAIAEIDRPGQAAVDAVGVIGKAGKKASDSADRHAEAEWIDEQITGRSVNAEAAFRDFDADPSAEQSADDRLSADERARISAHVPVINGRLDERENLRANQRAEHAPDDHPHVLLDRHALCRRATTQPQIKLETERISRELKPRGCGQRDPEGMKDHRKGHTAGRRYQNKLVDAKQMVMENEG